MEKTLLEKSRSINRILQKISGNPIDYSEMADVLSNNVECSVFIVEESGYIIGNSFAESAPCMEIDRLINHLERVPESFNQELISVQETMTNIKLEDGRKCLFNIKESNCDCSHRLWVINPVFGGAQRIGTLILTRENKAFTDEDIVLAEYGSMVVANEVMRMRTERIEEDARNKESVHIALTTLSYSEREAIEHILAELDGSEGLLVASRIADKAGITRSVIVSALRKFESAGVLESKSLGMKGTYIKILNDYIFDELKISHL